MLTERGKIILELVKSINTNDNLPYNLVVEKAVNEYNELIYNYYTEEPESWEESMRMFDIMAINP